MTEATPRPWWFPIITDAEWAKSIREEYDDAKDMDDDDIREEYAHGARYSTTWDHIGDAYDQFEPLADAYLLAVNTYDERDALLREALDFVEDCTNGCDGYGKLERQSASNTLYRIRKALGETA